MWRRKEEEAVILGSLSARVGYILINLGIYFSIPEIVTPIAAFRSIIRKSRLVIRLTIVFKVLCESARPLYFSQSHSRCSAVERSWGGGVRIDGQARCFAHQPRRRNGCES